MAKLLFVEDDKSFGYILAEYLKLRGYEVVWKQSKEEAINVLEQTFDMAILDINLKDGNGYEVAEMISVIKPELPFIFLSARDLKIDQLKGYKLGAEEYITKPVDEEILLAKVEAILARGSENQPTAAVIGYQNLKLDIKQRLLRVGETSFQLTEKECQLVAALMTNAPELVFRKEMLRTIWQNEDEFARNSMDVYISRLRKYLVGSNTTIRNVHGKGFILESVGH